MKKKENKEKEGRVERHDVGKQAREIILNGDYENGEAAAAN